LGRFITEDPIRDGDNWFAYVGNNPLAFTDPDGKKILGALKKLGQGVLEIGGGIGLAGGSGGLLAATGVVLILDGIGRVGLGLADLTASCLELSGRKPSIQSEDIPSSLGAIIGAAIDKSHNESFVETGNIGPAQTAGENINGLLTYAASTFSYINTARSNPAPKDAIINEISHQIDTLDLLTELVK
jgi:hypothetical protein